MTSPSPDDLDVAYGPLPAQRLDIYRPTATTPAAAPGAPAILMLHGGGWRTGDRSRFTDAAAAFTAAGILAVSADYRLAENTPGTQWPAQLIDAQAAFAWLSAHAQSLGADPARICVMGASAGGQLALFLGLAASKPGESPPPACVISLSGPTDLAAMMGVRGRMIKNLVGGQNRAETRQAALAASPITHIRPGACPTLLIHGLEDPVVPFAGAAAYHAALAQAGVPAWLLSHQGAHLLKGASRAARQAALRAQIDFALNHRLDTPLGRLDLA